MNTLPKQSAMSLEAAYDVAKELRIRILETDNPEICGVWTSGRTIVINPKRANAYTVLHEIGHVFCGLACCREHCEFMAHGAAVALARVYGIRLRKKWLKKIDLYAGYSPRLACGAILGMADRRKHTSYPK